MTEEELIKELVIIAKKENSLFDGIEKINQIQTKAKQYLDKINKNE